MLTILASTTRLGMVYMIAMFAVIGACSTPRDKMEGCAHEGFPGSAVFTEVRPVTDGFEVYFDFVLSDSTATVNFLSSDNSKNLQLEKYGIGGTQTVHPGDWLSANGISAGVEVPAAYQEIRKGSCVPWFISFPTITDAYGRPDRYNFDARARP